MPKSENQKLRILYLRDFLLKNSDEEHPLSVPEMIEALEKQGIAAERKTIYDDLRLLGPEGYGMDLIRAGHRYFVGDRDFSAEEIRLLVDMVQSSNFITLKKTDELIRKLEGLTSAFEGKLLNKNVYVRNRVKTMNESVYRNVDCISDAISADRPLTFRYFRYNVNKKKELRNGGRPHTVSPFALIWVDQNYYLLGYNHDADQMRHFRVDRMTELGSVEGPRLGKELFRKTDMSTYTSKVFYMFTGEETKVRMRFSGELVDTVIDRFGTGVILVPEADGSFTVTLDIVVSRQFFAWLSAFGTGAEILSPDSVRQMFRVHLQAILKTYE